MKNVLFGLSLSLIFLAGCAEKKAEPVKQIETPSTYYYYPRANVYLEPQGGTYTYLNTDGITWKESKELPTELDTALGKNVVLSNITYPVQQKNEEHLLVYSALLYAAPSDFKNEPVISQPSIKAKDEKLEETKEDKKALGRFIDKIFDKRKREERKKAKKGEAEKEG